MFKRIIGALLVLAAAGCSAGGGLHQPLPSVVQDAGVTAPLAQSKVIDGTRAPKPEALLTGLYQPGSLALHGNYVYVGDQNIWRVGKNGTGAQELVTGTSLFDSGANRGVGLLVISGQQLFAGFGGYLSYNIIRATLTGGSPTLLTSTSGGYFFGVSGTTAYYGSGFCCINGIPTAGGSGANVFSGVWVRSVAIDQSALYFVEYFTKNVYRFDLSTHVLTPLITGNPAEGQVVINSTTVFFALGSTIRAVPKTGGTPTTIYSGTAPQLGTANDTHVFFMEGTNLNEVPVAGGTTRMLVPNVQLTASVAGKHFLYYGDQSQGLGSSVVYKVKI
jgi:hypothetical protein